jgi:hypothetical protein
MRIVELSSEIQEVEFVIGASPVGSVDPGKGPLKPKFLSILMPPIQLPKRAVYRLYLICNGQEIGVETIHAR